jgi:putative transposase
VVHRAGAADTSPPLGRGLSRDASDTAGLAPQAGREQVRHEQAAQARPPELLDRILILNVVHLRAVLIEYQVHYNSARPHQGIAQRVPDAGRDATQPAITDLDIRRIRRKPVLNGLINEYTHTA